MQLCWTRKFEDVKIVNEEFACGSTFCAFFLTQGGCVPRILEDDLCFHTILKSTFLGGVLWIFHCIFVARYSSRFDAKNTKKLESKHWKIHSHSTLRAKRATFTFWVDKSLLKMPKNGPFWRVFKNLKLAVKQCCQTGQF